MPGDRRRQRTASMPQHDEEEAEWVMVPTSNAAKLKKGQATLAKKPKAVVVVDPISSGAVLALLAQQRGYQVLAVYRWVGWVWMDRLHCLGGRCGVGLEGGARLMGAGSS